MNGLCCAPDAPRALETACRPGTSGRSVTCASRAQAPVSPIITQSASERSSEALIAVRISTPAGPIARTVALRAMASWSRKTVNRTSTSIRAMSSVRVTVSVSASASAST